MTVFARRWWPVPVFVIAVVVIQKVAFESRFDVAGHAAEHLQSATAPFAAVAAMFLLFFTTRSALRQPAVLAAAVAWVAATGLVLAGNVRVVDALIDAGQGRTPTDALIEDATISSSHDLANVAPWLGVLTALALAAALFVYGHISRRVAIGAAVVSVLIPPWFIPGAGVLVVVVARCLAFQREDHASHLPSAS